MQSGMSVPTPTTVYAWPKSKDEFDKIALEASVFDWGVCETTTLIKNDGQQWESRLHAKAMFDGPVNIIFQWRDERPVAHQEQGEQLC